MANLMDLTGMEFGWLVAVRVETRKPRVKWLCQCSCGKNTVVAAGNLTSGHSRSCGCQRGALVSMSRTTHGLRRSPVYTTWVNMRKRCYDPGYKLFHRYGGRGITVCDRWRTSFENFHADMGDRPGDEYSIDRINNDGNYEPGNCRWATSQQQANNSRRVRRFVIDGEMMTLREWCVRFGADYKLARQRIKKGWAIHDAITVEKMAAGKHR